jgi:ubiquinone/menaquinone biosynthesis C-methylase UbiE
MPFSTADWHRRYQQQAGWSKTVRDHFFLNLNLPDQAFILEVGCGTGAVLADYSKNPSITTFGLDLDCTALQFSHNEDPSVIFTCGNTNALPYTNASFDLTFCHYLLLWLKNPLSAIEEMKRVTRPGGSVCAFAEPDYGGRIAYPDELAKLTDQQTRSLIQQGANPSIGRQLRHLFTQTGLKNIQTGVLASEWNASSRSMETEMEILANDLALLGDDQNSAKAIPNTQFPRDCIYLIPTFYACGQVD